MRHMCVSSLAYIVIFLVESNPVAEILVESFISTLHDPMLIHVEGNLESDPTSTPDTIRTFIVSKTSSIASAITFAAAAALSAAMEMPPQELKCAFQHLLLAVQGGTPRGSLEFCVIR